jgi:parallel beta-helix repeat protein
MKNSILRLTSAQVMFFALTAFGSQVALAWPTTIYVGSCGTPTAPNIQTAVNTVAVGGTVKVCPGTYPEQVLITRNVTLTGVASGNADAAVITSPATGVVANTADLYPPYPLPVAAQILVQNAKAVNISNLTVDGSNNLIAACAPDIRGIYYQNSSGTISEVATRNQVLAAGLTGCQAGQGIFVQSSYSGAVSANVTIKNSSVSTFQKNGITIDGPKATGTVTFNSITGQGPTTGAGENGVQISDGAAGSVTDNALMDFIWAPDVFGDTGDAAAGILIYASEHILVQNNIVGTAQFGIVTVSDVGSSTPPGNPQGLGDHATITSNVVINTQFYDAIDICSNDNSITGNTVFNAAESGIHLDSTCGSTGLGNTVTGNTINEACAGILYGTGSASGLAAHNSFVNVVGMVSPGDVCTAPPAPLVVTAAVPLFSAAAVSSGSASGAHPTPVR